MKSEVIIQALRTFFEPGDVFEIRVLDAVTPLYKREHIETGYFDYEHIETVPECLKTLLSYKGVYVTANPVDPDLLSRAVNRLKNAGRNSTTSDNDIVKRRWLLIDCDAKRKSGIPSSDIEHEFAIKKANEIADGFKSIGWASPIVIDSGNGAQLMYKTDIDISKTEIIKGILSNLSCLSDEHVEIDMSVYNLARIWRLPGTVNRKGDSTEKRPHRYSSFISIPDEIQVITESQLTEASKNPNTTSLTASNTTECVHNTDFDLQDWIRTYCPELCDGQPWQGGTKWVFNVCPFNSEHTDKSASLLQLPNGAIAFKCHHNGCINNDWQSLRKLKEGDDFGVHQNIPLVDMSGLLQSSNKQVVQETDNDTVSKISKMDNSKYVWRNITNDDVKKAIEGTMLGELTSLYASVTTPELPLECALLKAIVTIGCCLTGEAAREDLEERFSGDLITDFLIGVNRSRLIINTGGGQVNNIYAMLAGNSSSGKDIGNLLDQFANFPNPSAKINPETGMQGDYLLGTGGSSIGIIESLIQKPNGLLLISEMKDWLDKRHWQHDVTSELTNLFNKGMFNKNFSSRGGKRGNFSSRYCYPSIYANIQPELFDKLVSSTDIETGFLGRFLFARMPVFYGLPKVFDSARIMERMRSITEIYNNKKGIVHVPDNYSMKLHEIFKNNYHKQLNASWRRLANEYYPRLAVQLSVTNELHTQCENVVITNDTWKRAEVLTLWFFKNAEYLLLKVDDDSPDYAKQRETLNKKMVEIINDIYMDTGKPVSRRVISRLSFRKYNAKANAKERNGSIDELIDRGFIQVKDNGLVPFDIPNGYIDQGFCKAANILIFFSILAALAKSWILQFPNISVM